MGRIVVILPRAGTYPRRESLADKQGQSPVSLGGVSSRQAEAFVASGPRAVGCVGLYGPIACRPFFALRAKARSMLRGCTDNPRCT
jgi:hypothetical protein